MGGILWLQQDVLMEALALLAQHDFRFVPPPVRRLLSALHDGMNQSVIIENGFQKLQDVGREQKDSRMRRLRRWHYPVESQLLKEFGWSEVCGSMDMRPEEGDPKDIGNAAFEALGLRCSISDERLQPFLAKGAPKWLTLSAQGMQWQAGAWGLLMQARREGRWDMLPHAYGNLLLQEDTSWWKQNM